MSIQPIKNSQNAKPFLKWAGGKGQLLQRFQELYPEELLQNKIANYYEPFLGSGAVFFDLVQRFSIKSAYLCDINEDLILTYKVIQLHINELVEELSKLSKSYLKLDKQQRHDFFYERRKLFNEQKVKIDFEKYSHIWIQRAATIIFLNRTCYNGLYRVNLKGEFNAPFGRYENPTICDETNLFAVSKLLAIAEIRKANYSEVLHHVKNNSFVYFDPPYRPISKTSNFKSYSNSVFTDDEQRKLAHIFDKLDTKGIKVMLSNSDPKNIDPNDQFFDTIYNKYNIIRIPARRLINSNASKRGQVNEIVVTNY